MLLQRQRQFYAAQRYFAIFFDHTHSIALCYNAVGLWLIHRYVISTNACTFVLRFGRCYAVN